MRIIETREAADVKDLITILQSFVHESTRNPATVYTLGRDRAPLHVSLVENTLSDKSKVYDVIIR